MKEGLGQNLASSKEHGATWKEREANIKEGLLHKLEVVGEFNDILESIYGGSVTGSDGKLSLDQFSGKILGMLTEEQKAAYTQYLKDTKEGKILADKFGAVDFDDPNLEAMSARLDELIDAVRKVDDDPKLAFPTLMLNASAYIKSGIEKVELYKQNRDMIFEDLAKARGVELTGLKNLKIKEIQFTPISVNIVLMPGENVEALNHPEEFLGLHTRECFVNIIGGDQSEKLMRETMRHEDEHVITDALGKYMASLGPPIHRLGMVVGGGLPEVFLANREKEILSNKEFYTGQKMFDSSHHEILTALYESPAFISYLKSTQILEMGPMSIAAEYENKILNWPSTFAGEIRDMGEVLDKGKKSKNLAIRQLFLEEKARYMDTFSRSMANLGYAFLLAERFGEKAEKDAKLLTYILRPSQYHHIPKILRERYGK